MSDKRTSEKLTACGECRDCKHAWVVGSPAGSCCSLGAVGSEDSNGTCLSFEPNMTNTKQMEQTQ